jgi:hypothetical protein
MKNRYGILQDFGDRCHAIDETSQRGRAEQRVLRCSLALAALALGMAGFSAVAAEFTPGSIVAYRVGNGTAAVSASAGPVFLDEYSPNGTLLQSIALPTVAGTAPLTNALTASSTGSEGLMTRTVDGTCLTLAGYAAAVGTASVITASNVQRDVAFVNAAGGIDTTTTLGTLAFAGSNVRGAASDTCGHAWISGNGSGKTNYGVWYAALGATTGAQLVQTNAQGMAISNGQLYSSFSSSTFDTVGTGLPTSGTQTVSAVSANIATSNYRGVAFLKLQSGSTGNDTLYLADNVNNLISKYTYNGSNWVAAGGLSTAGISGVNTHGLMAANLGDGIVALYFTNSKAGILYQAFDTSGPTGTLASNTPYTAFATASGQPTDAVYYGLAPSPETALATAVPNAPSNPNATNVTASSFTANWTAPSGGATVNYYVVDLSYNSSFSPVANTTLVAANATSGNFTGLSNSTVYYRVRAVNDAGASTDASAGVNVPQTITFGQAPAVVVGGTGTLVATASSGLTVIFGSTTPSICTVSGNVVTGVAVGSCVVTGDQAGNNEYSAATEATQTINVVSAVQTQTITFGPAPNVLVGGIANLSATASSGLTVTFSSQTPGTCTVSGSTVTGVATGTCTVAADQAGNANYYAAPEVTQSFAVGQGSQTISFGSAPSLVYGGTGTVSATASSGLAVSFSSLTTAICTVSGSTVTGVAPGTCTIAANQAGNSNYLAAAQVSQSFTVGAATQTISFQSLPQVLVGGTATLGAAASSGLSVTFSSNTPTVCSVSGSAVTALANGNCVIAANQAGNADYQAASTVTQTFVVANPITTFTAGNLVISTVSGLNNGGADLDTASPIALQQFQLSSDGTIATETGALLLPQAGSAQAPISGEFGSASEGHLQLSVNGQYLAMMGYGVDAATFNSAPLTTYGTAALGQTTSLTAANQTGTVVTTVPRTVALIGINTSIDTSTQLTGLYNQNNPRSVATIDGTAFWTSGQGASKGDPTEGVAYAPIGASIATTIDNSTDTRVVEILNAGSGNTLYVSRDFKPSTGANDFTNVDTLTDANGNLPVASTGLVTNLIVPPASPLSLGGNNASINLTAQTANGVNNARIGSFVYLSPEQFFLASPTVLYVADSGEPKDGSANAAGLGEGGLQKWILVNGVWTLAYDLVNGLNLANNANANAATPTAPGVTGLLSLTGRVVVGQVQLFASTYGLNELSQSYVVEITDNLAATSISQVANEQFTTLYTDASGQTSIRGVSFAPGVEQTINVGTAPVVSVGGNGTLGATASSGLSVSYTSLTASVCTVSANVVTGVSAGTCTIAVDQAGTSTIMPAVEQTLSFAVGASLQSQSITFGAAPNVVAGGSGTVSATASSGLTVSFSSQTTAVCTVSGTTVMGVTAGTCTIAADQAGNSQYAAATEVTQTFAITAQTQTIAFGAAPALAVGGTASLSATASSGLTVTFSSQTTSVCTVSGSTVTGVSAGTCTVAADQAGNGVYAAAAEVTQSFAVGSAVNAGADNGDVPLPPWTYALLALAILEILRRYGGRRR